MIRSAVLLNPRSKCSSFNKLDVTVGMNPPVRLDPKKEYFIRGIHAQLSSRIPNVFKALDYVFDNSVVYVRQGIGGNYTKIQLSYGNYTAQQMGQAINAQIASWWSNPSDPGLIISANSVVDKISISIDSSKLAMGGQFCIDFSQNQLHKTFGFLVANSIIEADGVYYSTEEVKMDTQSTTMDISVDLTTCRNMNGKLSNILFSVPLILAQNSTTDFLYPPPGTAVIPLLPYNGVNTITSYTIKYRTSEDKPFYFLNGTNSLEFDICY